MPSNIETWDISWQNRTAFYDETRSEIQFMGKPQSSVGGRNRSPHWVYSEATGTWRTTSTNVTPNSYGHIWCVTFDHSVSPGDYYHVQHYPAEGDNMRTLLRYNRATNSWGKLPEAGFDLWNNSSTPNSGPVYHPNLLGPGRPGIYCLSNDGLSYFDVNNQSWVSVRRDMFYDSTYGDWKHNSSLYVPGLDLALFGSGQNGFVGGRPQCLIVESGNADDPTPPIRDLPYPVDNLNQGNTAHMLLDPTDPTRSTIMLLESVGGRVWTSNDPMSGASSWTLQSWSHPLWNNNPYRRASDSGSWTCCSIPRYGVVLGMGSQNGAGTILWRPDSSA